MHYHGELATVDRFVMKSTFQCDKRNVFVNKEPIWLASRIGSNLGKFA